MKKSQKPSDHLLPNLAKKDLRIEHGQLHLVNETELEQRKYRARRRIALSLLAILFLIIISWTLASFYLPKVQLDSQLIAARQSDAALQKLIQKQAAAYKLTIVYPDGSQKHFSLKDMGLGVDSKSTLTSLRHVQHRFGSRLQWWHPIKADLAVRSSGSGLYSFIDRQATVTIQPAQDATLSIDHGSVKLTDSTPGKHSGLVGPVASLTDAVSNLDSRPLHLQTLSTRPAISSRQLASYQAKLQSLLKQKVTFVIDNRENQASANDIASWIELTSQDKGKKIDITVNSGKVLAYINKIAAASVHPPKAQVEVLRDDGSKAVLVVGVNGTDVINKTAAATNVTQSLLQGKAVQENLSIQYAAYKTITAQAYAKWIEVDTTNKRMYAYEQSTLVQTFLVSAGAPKTPTVTGQYAIYAKYTQQDMRGSNVDGSNYFQPHVPWVNYFYGSYAIHGNYWRPLSYFGSINSSHGCVGVTVSDGEWIYSWAPIGTPVIIHA